MTEAIISIGSNHYAKQNFVFAKELITQHFTVLSESSTIVTQPIGKQYRNNFLNQAIKIQSTYSKNESVSIFKQIEKKLGRTSESKQLGIIPIDIDLIVWNNEIIHQDYQRFDFVKQTIDEIK